MTERYTKNNWGKNKEGKTTAEKAVADKIVINDGISKIVVNKNGDFYKENRKIVKTSVFNKNHGVTVTIMILLLITALLQVFYQLVNAPFQMSTISDGAKAVADDIIFIFPFALFILLTAYTVFVWIRENKTKKLFLKNYMDYLVTNYINKPGTKTSIRDEAEAEIRKDMKNQINIMDNGFRNDGKHRMTKELSAVVSIMATVGVGLIVLNIVIPFWISLFCQFILTACGAL